MATSKVLKPRRGSTAEHDTFKGQAFEITFDTDKKTIVAHDGLTMGGFPLAHEAAVAETDSALRALIDQKVSEVEGVSSSELRAIENALRGLINSNAQQQAARDADQDNVITVLDTTLRTLIAQEVAKYLPLAGGTVNYLNLQTVGGLARGLPREGEYSGALVVQGDKVGAKGAYIELINGEDVGDNPGGLHLATRFSDGTVGPILNLRRDGTASWAGFPLVRSVNGVAADAAGNVALGKSVYLTDSWVSGTSWYRKWSDGWIEQGGEYAGTDNAQESFVLNLNTAFTTTNYLFMRQAGRGVNSAQGNSRYWLGYKSKTTTSVTMSVEHTNGVPYGTWYACGY